MAQKKRSSIQSTTVAPGTIQLLEYFTPKLATVNWPSAADSAAAITADAIAAAGAEFLASAGAAEVIAAGGSGGGGISGDGAGGGIATADARSDSKSSSILPLELDCVDGEGISGGSMPSGAGGRLSHTS